MNGLSFVDSLLISMNEHIIQLIHYSYGYIRMLGLTNKGNIWGLVDDKDKPFWIVMDVPNSPNLDITTNYNGAKIANEYKDQSPL